MILAWIYILVPLVLFLAAFVLEAYMSFKRLAIVKPDSPYMLHTWETSHTFLVVSVACFAAFFTSNLWELADAAFYGLFLAALFAGVRAMAYVYIFYVRDPAKRLVRNWIDWVYAICHVGMAAGVVVLLVQLLPVLFKTDLQANTQFLPWMWPGLILVLALCSIPVVSLYSSRAAKQPVKAKRSRK